MRLKAFSLLETVVALSILAFVTAASFYHIGGLYSRSQIDMGQVYLSLKAMENSTPIKESIADYGAYQVESTIAKYSSTLDVYTVEAKHKTGRRLLVVKKLIRHEER